MASFSSRAALAAAFVLAACGGGSSSSGVNIQSLVPASGEVAGWSRSGDLRVLSEAEAMLGYNDGGLDGATDPFHDAGLAQVAVQDFANGGQGIKLRVWQLTSEGAATTAYDDSRTGASGQALDMGDAGRIADDGVNLTVNVRKGVYFVYAQINENTQDANTQVQALAAAVVGKIP